MNALRDGIGEVAAAFRYFSILPFAPHIRGNPPTTRTLAALPLVGLVLGALAGICALAVASIDARYAPATALAASVMLTGALHLDGFLDSCDALIASVDPRRRLEIMKDPRHGSFALAGLLILGIVWITALTAVAAQQLILVLAWSGCIARAAAVANACCYPYAPGGDGERAAEATLMPLWPAFWIAGVAAATLCIFPGRPGLAAWPPLATLFALALGRWASKRLGGLLVGDTYGAVICILDVLGIVVFGILQ